MMWDLEDLISASDVARMCGVSREAVSNWLQRAPEGFPGPIHHIGSRPVFSRKAIIAWAEPRIADQERALLRKREAIDTALTSIRRNKKR